MDPQGTGRGTALVRPVPDRLAEGIVTHVERTAVDVGRAREQHEAYAAALTGAGWRVRYVPEAPDHPDSVFVEDAVVVLGDRALLCRSGAPDRRGEVAGVEAVVASLGLTVSRVGPPATLDGGDVLQVGSTVYVGQGGRSDAGGAAALAAAAGPDRTVVPVPLGAVLHLKSAVTALPDGTAVGLRDLVPLQAFPRWVDAEEEAGCHLVPLGGDQVLLAASAPRTAERLAREGWTPVVVDIGEFEKLEGCVTCLSVLVPVLVPGATG